MIPLSWITRPLNTADILNLTKLMVEPPSVHSERWSCFIRLCRVSDTIHAFSSPVDKSGLVKYGHAVMRNNRIVAVFLFCSNHLKLVQSFTKKPPPSE